MSATEPPQEPASDATITEWECKEGGFGLDDTQVCGAITDISESKCKSQGHHPRVKGSWAIISTLSNHPQAVGGYLVWMVGVFIEEAVASVERAKPRLIG